MRKETVEIKKMGINGEGIGYVNQKVVFVKGALLGEQVEVEIVASNKNYEEGKLCSISKRSTHRCKPKCEQSDTCQGCSLLHMPYRDQLRYKEDIVKQSLRKYTNYNLSSCTFRSIVPCPPADGFMTSINVPIVRFKNTITFGIYQRNTQHLTVIAKCMKLDLEMQACLEKLSAIFTIHGCKTYSDRTKTGLRFLKMRRVDKALQAVIITGRDALPEAVIADIKKIKQVKGLFVSRNTSRYQNFEDAGYTKIFGETKLPWYYNDHKYLVSIKSLSASNYLMDTHKMDAMLGMVSDSQRILSIGCGIGAMELESQKEVVAFDAVKSHIEDAKVNQKWAKNTQVKFIYNNVEQQVVSHAKQKKYDTFVLQGDDTINEEIIESIIHSKAKYIIYSSDVHFTMAKNLASLQRYYRLLEVITIDSDKYTPYVTTLVKLQRK